MIRKRYQIIAALLFSSAVLTTFFLALIYLYQQPTSSKLSPDTHIKSYIVWDYLLHSPTNNLLTLDALSVAEKRHLLDVKRLLSHLHTACISLWLASVVAFLFLKKVMFKQTLRYTAIITLMLLGLSSLLAFIYGFKASFILFHQLLFPAGTWWFSTDSLLIHIFPLVYFQEFIMLYIGACTLFSVCVLSLLRSQKDR